MKSGIKAVVFILIVLLFLGGCNAKPKDYFTVEGHDQDWTLELPMSFELSEEENHEEFKIYAKTFKNSNGMALNIMESPDEGAKIASEESLKESLSIDNYFALERTETIDLEGIGKIYGALVEDHATESHIFFYQLNLNGKLISIGIYQRKPFTMEEEAQIKGMITTLKKK